jgi:hypothetical protein
VISLPIAALPALAPVSGSWITGLGWQSADRLPGILYVRMGDRVYAYAAPRWCWWLMRLAAALGAPGRAWHRVVKGRAGVRLEVGP